jgi:hypothetical protein
MRAVAVAAALLLGSCAVQLEGAACETDASCRAGEVCWNDGRCAARPAACGAPGPELYADPAGGQDPALVPNGAAEPVACRFSTLTSALAAAATRTEGRVVRAAGVAPITFGPGETFPIVLAADVTLLGASDDPGETVVECGEPLAPAVLSVDGSVLSLGPGAVLAGVTVRNAGACPAAAAIEASCDGDGSITLRHAAVEAAGHDGGGLATGVHVDRGCRTSLENVVVSGAAGAGIEVDFGALDVKHAVIRANGGAGLVARDCAVKLDDVVVKENGDTGVVLSTVSALDVRATRVCRNGATTARGTPFTERRVGGIHLYDEAPPGVVFRGNGIFGNAGDQILVAGSAAVWSLDGAASLAGCPNDPSSRSDANVIRDYDTDTATRGVVAACARVSARFDVWNSPKPNAAAGRDYGVVGCGGASTSVDAGADSTQFCPPVATPPCE